MNVMKKWVLLFLFLLLIIILSVLLLFISPRKFLIHSFDKNIKVYLVKKDSRLFEAISASSIKAPHLVLFSVKGNIPDETKYSFWLPYSKNIKSVKVACGWNNLLGKNLLSINLYVNKTLLLTDNPKDFSLELNRVAIVCLYQSVLGNADAFVEENLTNDVFNGKGFIFNIVNP